MVQGQCCTLSNDSLHKTLSSLSLLGIDVNVLEDISLAFEFNSELPKRSVTVQHNPVNLSRGARLAVAVNFDMYSLPKVAIFLRNEGSTLNKGPWRTQRALSCWAGERTEVRDRQPIRNERIDEVPVIVVLLDFLHGAIMLALQLATLRTVVSFEMVAAYDRALCSQECMQGDTVWTAKIAAHPTLNIP